ncbi:hypothetical protein HDF10_001479 [Edaphobacter lichenicola]|uniref:Uncharacterized protein n=1 Tax=Tunturiibacter lichenicola TaxID=2051959 RepID=A0A7W8N2W2_9BACT|nr:hypothetical protein [Edaphobacter lichenicola]
MVGKPAVSPIRVRHEKLSKTAFCGNNVVTSEKPTYEA